MDKENDTTGSKANLKENKEQTKPHGSQRPGGRTAIIGERVATCTLNFLREGNNDFTIADVAETTGIHRSTIYRRWPSKEHLLQEALRLHASSLPVPNTGAWESDLNELCHTLANFARDPVELAIMRTMAQAQQQSLAMKIHQQWMPQMQRHAEPIRAAKTRGEIARGVSSEMLLGMILSPLLLLSMINNGNVPDNFVQLLENTVLALTRQAQQ